MMSRKMLALVFAGALMSGPTAYAHHSLAATYHADQEVKLEGKIIDFLFRNPHSFLQIEAPDEKGVMQRWSLEWRSSGQLGQQGIKRDTLKVGDEVVVTINPSRTPADHRGALKTLHRKSDGFGWGNNPGDTIE
jgi:Family of unknown function (DUF6152)